MEEAAKILILMMFTKTPKVYNRGALKSNSRQIEFLDLKGFERNWIWIWPRLIKIWFDCMEYKSTYECNNSWTMLLKMISFSSENRLFCQSFTTILLSFDYFIRGYYWILSNLKKEIWNWLKFVKIYNF